MIVTSTGKITNKVRETKRMLVLVEHGLFTVEIPWYEFDKYHIGQMVEISYLPDDQFATLVKEAVKA